MSFENFPYSNFHDLNLDWIINEWKKTYSEFLTYEEAFKSLKDFVNNYFDDLNIQEEINKKLDEMYNNGQLSQLLNKFYKIVVFGDSYGVGRRDDVDNPNNGWVAYLSTMIDSHIINYCVGGSGFIGHYGDDNNTYLNQMKKAVNEGNNDASIVIVCGGSNDNADTPTSTDINTTLEYLNENFKNARKYVIFGSLDYRFSIDKKLNTLNIYKKGALNNKMIFSEISSLLRLFPNTCYTDNLHLTDNGYKNMAYLIQCLLCNSSPFIDKSTIELTSGYYCNISKNGVLISTGDSGVSGALFNGVGLANNLNVYTSIYTNELFINLFKNTNDFIITSNGFCKTDTTYTIAFTKMKIEENEIKIKLTQLNAKGTSYEQITNNANTKTYEGVGNSFIIPPIYLI